MIVYGKQIFLYILNRHPDMIEEIYLTKEIDKKLFSKIQKGSFSIMRLDNKKAQALARGGNHQGYIVKMKDYSYQSFDSIKSGNFVVVLAGITDVGNIGAIVRSAYALGASGVLITMLSQVNIGAVIRSSSGAALDMPIFVKKDIITALNELKQSSFTIYGADLKGDDVRESTFDNRKKALVIGSEGLGLTKRVLNMCDKRLKIKMQREFDSLNVSAATAILCDRMR
jgi:23S rRNA (guanosine2251-2'-O)-methyltransferase